jgi:hypothetical protein
MIFFPLILKEPSNLQFAPARALAPLCYPKISKNDVIDIKNDDNDNKFDDNFYVTFSPQSNVALMSSKNGISYFAVYVRMTKYFK